MKFAVISDIHGNLPALMAVSEHIEHWRPDIVIVVGDIINRGPDPRGCLKFITNKSESAGWQVLFGNHEEYVLSIGQQLPIEGTLYAFHQPTIWTYRQIIDDLQFIHEMKTTIETRMPDQSTIRFIHGSMIHNRDGIYPETTEDELRAKIAPAPTVFVTAHTHRPLIRKIDDSLVVNSGSVGLPFDGDCRASYARLSWSRHRQWQAKIVRVPYNINQTLDQYHNGFSDQGGPVTEIMRTELIQAQSLLYGWVVTYREKVLDAKISVKSAVNDYLSHNIAKS